MKFRGSIVVSIPACHAGDPGSIPGLGVILFDRGEALTYQPERAGSSKKD